MLLAECHELSSNTCIIIYDKRFTEIMHAALRKH